MQTAPERLNWSVVKKTWWWGDGSKPITTWNGAIKATTDCWLQGSDRRGVEDEAGSGLLVCSSLLTWKTALDQSLLLHPAQLLAARWMFQVLVVQGEFWCLFLKCDWHEQASASSCCLHRSGISQPLISLPEQLSHSGTWAAGELL